MSQYRKKPVVIEAVRFTYETVDKVCAFLGDSDAVCGNWQGPPGARTLVRDGPSWVNIQTLEGTMMARLGDWIIKGIKGEFYPCKPDIFAATYEPAEENQEALGLSGEAQRDTARLDWLDSKRILHIHGDRPGDFEFSPRGMNLRAAIDAAMEPQEKP